MNLKAVKYNYKNQNKENIMLLYKFCSSKIIPETNIILRLCIKFFVKISPSFHNVVYYKCLAISTRKRWYKVNKCLRTFFRFWNIFFKLSTTDTFKLVYIIFIMILYLILRQAGLKKYNYKKVNQVMLLPINIWAVLPT